ncbi:response regulator [Paenibacillus sp. JNUCC31]|uniref:response regulator n=1 Tax=Paenibacillus sp. JNUCC-31 TaxID=2777983 RepID=UPI00177F2ECA|nr:response regulator [Paenibacillus sp. JNUCC-31]QOS79571.1 response regulator [Paenibacillus sp. JNUCC-31]
MKAILIDDELLALSYLELQLMKMDNFSLEIIGKFTNPYDAMAIVKHTKVDIAFIDIELPEINGIELAERLLEDHPGLMVVFVTAYQEYAVEAFELNAMDYIVKPVRFDRLSKTMNRILSKNRVSFNNPDPHPPLRMTMFRQVMIEEPQSPGQFSLMQWRTSRAQELFLYLLQHRGQLVRKSFIVDLLWSNIDLNKAYSQLYTTIYHIRKSLTPYEKRFQIKSANEGYLLELDNIILDVAVWDDSSQTIDISENLELYLEKMSSYTGDYLQEYDYWWAEGERQRLKQLWLNTALRLGQWYEDQQRFNDALASYLQIRHLYPMEEKSSFALMKLYDKMSEPQKTLECYQELTTQLKEEYDIPPGNDIQLWVKEWKKKQLPLKSAFL